MNQKPAKPLRKNARLPEHSLSWAEYLSRLDKTEETVLQEFSSPRWNELLSGILGWLKKNAAVKYVPSDVIHAAQTRGVVPWEMHE